MTGHSAIKVIGRIRGLDLRPHGHELAERFQLDLDVRVSKMSRGMRQKLGLILCFAHQPRVLILDEPSSGLDPLMQIHLKEYLLARASQGVTVFFSISVPSRVKASVSRQQPPTYAHP